MYRRALAASGAAIVLSIVAMSPMFDAAASTAPAVVSIAQVQGTGSSTPVEGTTVTAHGIVTAVLPGLGGFYLQSQTSSAIAGASDGIFVATTHTSFSAGDLVTVTGVAGEAKTQTQIAASSVALITAGAGLPVATALPASVVGSAREAYEGMLVTTTGTYYLDSVNEKSGSLTLSAGSATATATNRILLDDGTNATVTTQPFLVADTAIRAGDTLVAAQKPLVLGAGASGYRLEPLVPLTPASSLAYKPTFTAVTPRLGDAPTIAP